MPMCRPHNTIMYLNDFRLFFLIFIIFIPLYGLKSRNDVYSPKWDSHSKTDINGYPDTLFFIYIFFFFVTVSDVQCPVYEYKL